MPSPPSGLGSRHYFSLRQAASSPERPGLGARPRASRLSERGQGSLPASPTPWVVKISERKLSRQPGYSHWRAYESIRIDTARDRRAPPGRPSDFPLLLRPTIKRSEPTTTALPLAWAFSRPCIFEPSAAGSGSPGTSASPNPGTGSAKLACRGRYAARRRCRGRGLPRPRRPTRRAGHASNLPIASIDPIRPAPARPILRTLPPCRSSASHPSHQTSWAGCRHW